MTQEEAKKVMGMMFGADGGCPVCVRSLLADFVTAFGFRDEAFALVREWKGQTTEDDLIYALGECCDSR